jgi:hypothetical protein
MLHHLKNVNSRSYLFVLILCPEGKFLATKFKFGGSFGMNLVGDYHELDVTLYLELLDTFGMRLDGVCHT